MNQLIKESGRLIIKDMEKALIFGKMGQFMKEVGRRKGRLIHANEKIYKGD